MRKNIACDTDAYKIAHWMQRPEGITSLYSYGEPRVGGKNKEVCFFGLQPILQNHFTQKVTNQLIEEAAEESFMTFGTDKLFNKDAWNKVKDLGYLPLKIMSAPEGTIMEEGNVCFTIEATEKFFAPMVSHFEDLLMWTWYTTSVCTRSMNIKRGIIPAFKQSSDAFDFVLPVAVNDFGLRGASLYDAAVAGGMAHLVHFRGSDNMPASRHIKDFYGMKGRALSVWATEHSVATSFGPGRGEYDYLRHQLTQFPELIKSIVIDSYDDENFIRAVVADPEMVALIKQHAGRVVFRPDSGDPLKNVCKYSDMLGAIFGFSMNSKGYKVINHNVGLIQGDGMTEETIPALYNEYIKTGWAADNVLTGSGGGLLEEGLTRDTQRWAIKASYGELNGVPFDIQKKPKSDMTKVSKSGRLKLHNVGRNKYLTIESSKETPQDFNSFNNSLVTVFENGQVFPQSFESVLENASKL